MRQQDLLFSSKSLTNEIKLHLLCKKIPSIWSHSLHGFGKTVNLSFRLHFHEMFLFLCFFIPLHSSRLHKIRATITKFNWTRPSTHSPTAPSGRAALETQKTFNIIYWYPEIPHQQPTINPQTPAAVHCNTHPHTICSTEPPRRVWWTALPCYKTRQERTKLLIKFATCHYRFLTPRSIMKSSASASQPDRVRVSRTNSLNYT